MTKLTNWQKFDNAFKSVSAYVVMDQETMQPIAKIALKFPSDGAQKGTLQFQTSDKDAVFLVR